MIREAITVPVGGTKTLAGRNKSSFRDGAEPTMPWLRQFHNYLDLLKIVKNVLILSEIYTYNKSYYCNSKTGKQRTFECVRSFSARWRQFGVAICSQITNINKSLKAMANAKNFIPLFKMNNLSYTALENRKNIFFHIEKIDVKYEF